MDLRVSSTTVQWWAVVRIENYGWKESNGAAHCVAAIEIPVNDLLKI
jgi:hypothetical protein